MVVKEEPNKLGCSNELKNLQSELVFSNNDANNVNEDEIIRGLEDIINELEEDSSSTNVQDSAGSDAGEINDNLTKEQEKQSKSEAGEIDDSSTEEQEKQSGSEAREIDDSSTKEQDKQSESQASEIDDSSTKEQDKKSGSEAGEIDDSLTKEPEKQSGSEAGEIDDSSTKEQEKQSGSEAGEIDKEESFDVEEGEISESAEKKPVCRFFIRGCCYYGSQCQFLHVCDKVYKMFDISALSNGSKKTIIPSILSEIPQHPMEDSSSWEKGLKTAKVMIQDSIKKKKEDKEFENKKLYISPEIPKSTLVYSREKEFKSKNRTSEREEKAIQAELKKGLTATRETERKKEKQCTSNKENSKSEYKWVDPWMRSNKKDSKTHTSKRKHKKRHCSLSSASSLDSIDMDPKQDYKKRKLNSRDSCCRSYSKSRSRSRSSSRTHSSYYNHSRKNSPSYQKSKRRKMGRSSSLENWYKKEVSAVRHSRSPSCSSMDSLKSYESSMTISSLSGSQTSSSSTNEQVSNHTKRDKKSLDSKFADAFPRRQRIATSSIEDLQAYIRRNKQKALNLKDAALKQTKVSPIHTKATVPEAKSSIKPGVKIPLKKKNPALRELLRYANIKPKASSVISQTSKQQASKLQDLDSSTSDCTGFVATDPRKNITLNLQTSKLLKPKIPEVQAKQSSASELPNKEIISKKESLLKQLRLVEQAIARKKNSY